MAFVLDASVTMAWTFPDERSEIADAALELLQTEQAMVPALWWFEIRNVLIMGERRGRFDAVATVTALARLAQFSIQVDSAPDETSLLDLARRHRLTIYDAAYLEIATRRGIKLATLDKAMRAAAQADGISLVMA